MRPVRVSLVTVPLPFLPSSIGRITAVHPLPNRLEGQAESPAAAAQGSASFPLCDLLAVNDRAELLHVSLLQGDVRMLAHLDMPEFNPLKPIQVVTDPHGRYAAVSNRFGRYAAVFALPDAPSEQAAELLKLDRGSYYTDKSLFPLAFAEPDHRTLLIHGSDWNRLELTELPSLRPLTARAMPDSGESERPSDKASDEASVEIGASGEPGSGPVPFLNYFHGRLQVSPDGSQIADSGWVWQPVGLIGAWSLREWLADPWASENGESLKHFFQTEDWDLPAAWIDNDRLAVWGRIDTDLLDEEDWQHIGDKPAIVVYDVRTGQISCAAQDVPPYLRSTAFVPSSECFPYPLGDMAFQADRLFFWGRSVPLHVWPLPPMNEESAVCAGTGKEPVDQPVSEAASGTAPEPVTTEAFYHAIYHPGAELFIDLQPDGSLQAFRLADF